MEIIINDVTILKGATCFLMALLGLLYIASPKTQVPSWLYGTQLVLLSALLWVR